MGVQLIDCCLEIIHSKGDDRKASRNWIEWRERPALEDDQIRTIQIKMRAMATVQQQFQSDDIAIEVGSGGNIFSPQAHDDKCRWHGGLLGMQRPERFAETFRVY